MAEPEQEGTGPVLVRGEQKTMGDTREQENRSLVITAVSRSSAAIALAWWRLDERSGGAGVTERERASGPGPVSPRGAHAVLARELISK